MDAVCFVGLEIDRRDNGSIHLSQKAYTRKIVDKFRMSDSKSIATPAENYSLVSTDLVKKLSIQRGSR